RAFGAGVVAGFACERAEEREDLGAPHVHRGGELQLREGLGVVAACAREVRELHVDLRALRRTTTPVPLDETVEDHARLVVATGATERIGERDAELRREQVTQRTRARLALQALAQDLERARTFAGAEVLVRELGDGLGAFARGRGVETTLEPFDRDGALATRRVQTRERVVRS